MEIALLSFGMAGPRRLTSCGLGTVLVSERAVFCSSTKPNLLDISDLNLYIINLVVCFFLPPQQALIASPFPYKKRRLGHLWPIGFEREIGLAPLPPFFTRSFKQSKQRIFELKLHYSKQIPGAYMYSLSLPKGLASPNTYGIGKRRVYLAKGRMITATNLIYSCSWGSHFCLAC